MDKKKNKTKRPPRSTRSFLWVVEILITFMLATLKFGGWIDIIWWQVALPMIIALGIQILLITVFVWIFAAIMKSLGER